jgi:polynucleotide 5'-kinase involved in rRNA processing
MFEEFDKTLKAKLISLYESFIKNPQEKNLRENAATITQRYANSGEQISSESNEALGKAYDLELGMLSVDEAKKILEKLRKKE